MKTIPDHKRKGLWLIHVFCVLLTAVSVAAGYFLVRNDHYTQILQLQNYSSTEDFSSCLISDVEGALRYNDLRQELETDGQLNFDAVIKEYESSLGVYETYSLNDAITYGQSIGIYFDETNHLIVGNEYLNLQSIQDYTDAYLQSGQGSVSSSQSASTEEDPPEETSAAPARSSSSSKTASSGSSSAAGQYAEGSSSSGSSSSSEGSSSSGSSSSGIQQEYVGRAAASVSSNEKVILLRLLYDLAEYYELQQYFFSDLSFHFRIVYLTENGDMIVCSNGDSSKNSRDYMDSGKFYYLSSESEYMTFNISRTLGNKLYELLGADRILDGGTYEILFSVDKSYLSQDHYHTGYTAYNQDRLVVGSIIFAMLAALAGFIATLVLLIRDARPDGKAAVRTHKAPLELICFLWMLPVIAFACAVDGIIRGCLYSYAGNLWVGLPVCVVCYFPSFAGIISFRKRLQTPDPFSDSMLLTAARSLQEDYRGRPRKRQEIRQMGARLTLYYLASILLCIGIVVSFSLSMRRVLLQWQSLLLFFWCLAGLLGINGYMVLRQLRKNSQDERITRIIYKMSQGELNEKVDLTDMGGQERFLAESVNKIDEGLKKALEEQVKSERMKTDLIANVSHDLRTPLTSIINYVDLLKRENIDNERVQNYLDILERKSLRLKHLTEDLVDASKISSGNMPVNPIRLDFVELVTQVNGEFQEKFEVSQLKPVVTLPDKPVVLMSDGRLLFRILENLYNNACKYAMKGTRVYIDVAAAGKEASFTIKNISADPLNIGADELTERFIRGDVSRSTEGSGLGLSIAKSLVEVLQGRFEIYLDGDLFRVGLWFPLYEAPKAEDRPVTAENEQQAPPEAAAEQDTAEPESGEATAAADGPEEQETGGQTADGQAAGTESSGEFPAEGPDRRKNL